MNFLLEAVRDKPQGLWMMDDTTPLQDYSGYLRSGAITGTTVRHPSITTGAVYSQVFGNTVTGSVPAAFIKQTQTNQSFSLEAFIIPLSDTLPITGVLSHAGEQDGITIEGNVISFSTKYASSGVAKVSFTLFNNKRCHVVGVHTASKNSLYIDGVLVSETEISEAQMLDTYSSAATDFVIGEGATANAVAIGAVAVYAHALTAESVQRHYERGTTTHSGKDVSTMQSGILIPVDNSNADTFIRQTWNSAETWNTGNLLGVSVYGGVLIPQVVNDLTVSGSWIGSVVLESDTGPVYGVSFDWQGVGITVDVSLNGTAWTPATRGRKISIISENSTPTSNVVQVRVTFPAGAPTGAVYLKSLTAVGFDTSTLPAVAGRTVTLTGATPQKPFDPAELEDGSGTRIEPGGLLTINAPSTTSPVNPRTVEVWIKTVSATQPTFSFSGTNYRDGVASSAAFILGKWTLVHVTNAAAITGAITITGECQVGQVVIYDRQLTATEISNISSVYAGTTSLRVDDGTLIDVTQVADAATIYAYDWSILAAGG